jgi:multicomponent Na+:H+ antiporter subunit B
MRLDVVLRVGVKLIIPFMLIFGLYVQLHGDYGPGGGFQAGVIVAGAVIVYALIFGNNEAQRVIPRRVVEFLVPLGVFIYAATGVVGLFHGQNFLDYSVLTAHAPAARERGILLVEAGVLVTVASTMIALFYAFTERGR